MKEDNNKKNNAVLSQTELGRMRRLSLIKIGTMLVFLAIILVIGALGWFTMSREVEGEGMQMTSSDLPFEIATKGEIIRNQDVISSKKTEYKIGTPSGEYYKDDSLLLRFDPVDDPTTPNVNEELNPPDIAPGGSGSLNLYIVPKNNDSFNVKITLNVIAFAEFEKKNGNATVYKKDENNQNILDAAGNPIPDTVLVEITNTSDFADAATNAGNTTVAADAANYVKAASYLKGHILFFGEQNQNNNSAYYYADPLYYSASNGQPVQQARTKIITIEASNKDQMIPIPIYWMWTNTLGQIALPDNVSEKRNGLPVLSDSNAVGKNALKEYLKSNRAEIFANNSNNTSGYIDIVTAHVDSATNFDTVAFKDLSDGYNQADYEIGTKISYFLIEVSVGLDEQ